jgi:PAS domain S-box-containing protein
MSNAQILVVEDEGVVAKCIQNDLQSMGYSVPEVASSGEEAVQQAEGTRPDLVLMDVVLKGNMDGIEAAERIRQNLDVPIVYLTAYEDVETLSRAKITEPFGYLLKPFEERELHATIEMALYKHRTEAQLKATERWLATTLHSIADSMIATDARLRIRLINPAAERLLGCGAHEAFGRDLAEICTLVRGDEPTVLESLAATAAREQRSMSLTGDLTAHDGRETPVEGSLAPILDDGRSWGFVFILRDIGERKALEQVQRQNEEHLRHAHKMEAIGRLAGGVAHDFNNLLTVMLGNASLARARMPEEDPNSELLAAVEAAAERAALRVEQLLGLSGHSHVRLEPLNLSDTVRELTGLLRKGVATRIDLEFKLADDLWTVQADRLQFAEVVSILCQNAQEAMPNGGRLYLETENVTIAADQKGLPPQARPGDYVRVRARDTGRGIPPEIQDRIFEPYFSTKDFPAGNGLGLALAHGFAEQHHGWIDCASSGQGTRFDLYLPRYAAASVRPPAAAPQTRRNSTTTILLADDEPLLRDLAQTILVGQGYQVLLAEDGQQAVEIFQRERYQIDLVILDLAMPRLSGDDACRQLLEIDPGVRIVFSTAYRPGEPPVKDDRVLGIIPKPYRQGELLRGVRAALEQANVPTRDILLMLAKRLEQALAADSNGREHGWTERVSLVLERVAQMLEQHLAEVAAPDGPFAQADRTKPSVNRHIERLRRQYAEFLEQARALREDVERASAGQNLSSIRERLRAFVAELEHYRKEEINLVMDSVTTDIGAGD